MRAPHCPPPPSLSVSSHPPDNRLVWERRPRRLTLYRTLEHGQETADKNDFRYFRIMSRWSPETWASAQKKLHAIHGRSD